MAKKRLLILITNPFAALNVIHSGLLLALSAHYEIEIWSDRSLSIQFKHFNNTTFPDSNHFFPNERVHIRLLRSIQKSLYFEYFSIQTETIRRKSANHFGRSLAGSISQLFVKIKLALPALRILRSTIQILTAQTIIPKLTEFDGILSTSPLDIRENTIVNSAGKSARTMAMVISWDNLTSKGVINAYHDAILVWNCHMEHEINQQYSIYTQQLPRIFITGNPRFDRYFETSQQPNRSRSNNILFTTSAAAHFPEQPTIAKHLAEYVSTRPNVLITIRCHIFDNPDLYAFVQSRQIRIEPAAISDGLPAPDYLDTLHRDLQGCYICIQVASTIRIDAAACNRHVISIAYDGDVQKPYYQSVRRFYDYTHQLPLNTLQFDHMVYSKNQLFSKLDELFDKSGQETDTRNRVKSFTHFDTPSAIGATISAIEEWLR